MTSAKQHGWRKVAGLLFTAAAFSFLGYYVARNAGELREYEWTVRPELLVLSIALNVIGLSWGVRVWQLLLRAMRAPVAYLDLAGVWFVSGLGRYVPGKIWQFVGAAHLGGAAGLSGTNSVTSLAVHTGFFLVGAVLVAIYLLPAAIGGSAEIALQVMRWAGPLILVLVHPAIIRTGIRVVQRVTGRQAAWEARWVDGVKLVLLSAVGWLISGVAFYLFVWSLAPLPLETIPGVIGINAFAFVIGYAVFIAPAGLGAKEGALTALLSIYLPAPVAVVVAVGSRLWTVLAEVIPALLLIRRIGIAGGIDSPPVSDPAREQ